MTNLPGHREDGANSELFPNATAILTIDLDALARNYQLLSDKSGDAMCAAVVKADAYGIGLEQAVQRLSREGCDVFFVANLGEAERLRRVDKEADLYVLGGLLPSSAQTFSDLKAMPVLNSVAEVQEWADFVSSSSDQSLHAAVQVDTGMNRLGMKIDDLEKLVQDGELKAFPLSLLMSHLACADTPDHPLNHQQLGCFERARALLPDVPASLCNSAGIFLGEDYHCDLTRPGIALYGGRAQNDVPNPMEPVVRLDARIAQLQTGPAGETVGYGAAQTLIKDTVIATLSLGYADGYFRCLGSTDEIQNASVFIDGKSAPLIGRVSMDLVTADVSGFPEERVSRGNLVEVIGPNALVDDLADQANTIGYEILTSLGARYQRVYRG